MMGNTTIAWTDKTWNPIRGCSMAKGSELGGCLNCYAARMAARNLPELKSPTTGESFARILPSGPRWTGEVELIENTLYSPLKWRKPQRVFVNSMSDLFHEALPDEAIDRVFAVMALTPHITYQVLTKRPERMLEYIERGIDGGVKPDRNRPERRPLPNLWLGVSCEDQTTADARIPTLLQTPAAKRFISYEPALGPVDFTALPSISGFGRHLDSLNNSVSDSEGCSSRLDWIIIGGESGPGARPFNIAWARNTLKQCKQAGVACFVKQLGAKIRLKDRKGGDWLEWPEDLRVRQFPA